MRWPWVRRARLEDAQRRAQEADWHARGALQQVDRGLVPLILEPVPNPPMVTLVWDGVPPFSRVYAAWPFDGQGWAGLEREQLEPLIADHNALVALLQKGDS